MLALVVVSVLWAFSFGLIRRYLVTLDSSAVALLRLALSLLTFAPWLRLRPVAHGSRLWLMGIGVLQFGVMYLLYIEAFRYLHAYQVALLTLLTPLFVCLFDAALERRVSLLALFSASLAAIGALIVVGSRPLGHAQWRGVLLVQGSNAVFALGQLLYRRFRLKFPEHPDLLLVPWLYLGATLVAVPFAAQKAHATCIAMTLPQALVVVYLGVVASGLGFFLWNLGSVRVNAGTLAVMNNAKVPLGVLVSLVVFGETMDALRLVVGGLIFALAAVLAERDARISPVLPPPRTGHS